MGKSSRSTVRWMRLYSICRAEKGVQPRRSARVLACETTHAGVSEIPT